MITIEFDGSWQDQTYPWKVTTDDGTTWHSRTELHASVELAQFILHRLEQSRRYAPEPPRQLPDGAVII